MSFEPPTPAIDARAKQVSRNADMRGVAEALVAQRAAILDGWQNVATRQPFHAGHPDRAIADHIPALFDALTDLLSRDIPGEDIEAPMDDAAVAAAARAHAQMRFEQSLGPVAIATEFRLLRQEISRALRVQLEEDLSIDDVVSSLAVVNDALDGATNLALSALTDRIETVREEFLATTLHDVRQPIVLIQASLVLAARWARREPLDLVQLTETLDGALVATQEMSHLVETLADASRAAMGALDLIPEPVVVREIIKDALDTLDATGRRRVTVDSSLASGAVVYWDRQSIRRVLTNLLTNALKYSPPESPVTVTVTQDVANIEVTVRDHGMGLLPDEKAILFQRYSRTAEARTRGLPGVGLGLFACKGLVEAHGGRIALESDGRDQGTTARILLPIGKPDS
ncbi:MAG TPA: HAMP domain-containing sensor histidine kinase [Candidatus Limnocylindrales bacterium]|nr:HAMP domain-containing sensor histidine kinase [Candidatus Limnocylindrales bacterium]